MCTFYGFLYAITYLGKSGLLVLLRFISTNAKTETNQ